MADSSEVPSINVSEGEDVAVEQTLADATQKDPLCAGTQPRRDVLDASYVEQKSDVSLWGIIKKNAGKKLSQVSMPVSTNEPLSALQRLCEELEYSALLDRACDDPDPLHRLALVASFAASMYAGSFWRIGRKPFNPILGETYECVRPDRGFRFVAEQVSHHPPISVCHAESSKWTYSQEVVAHSVFRGTYIHVLPEGFLRITFKDTGDCFEWSKVPTNIEGVLSGTRVVDHTGTTFVSNTRTGDVCRVDFTKASRLKKSQRRDVTCRVYPHDPSLDVHAAPKALPKPAYLVQGKWNTELTCTPGLAAGQPSEVIWTAVAPPSDCAVYYGMGAFARQLNECSPADSAWQAHLPASDSRLRPDQRLLEQGRTEEAGAEKIRVEDQQRSMAAERASKGVVYVPLYFERKPKTTGAFASHAKPMSPATRRKILSSQDSGAGATADAEAAAGAEDDSHLAAPSGLLTDFEWSYRSNYWKLRAQGQAQPIAPIW